MSSRIRASETGVLHSRPALTLQPRGHFEVFQRHHLTNLSFPSTILAGCTSTITSAFTMFKWGRSTKSSSYEPKTPKLSSVSLPDERYVPVHHYQSYSEKPASRNSFLRHFTPDKHASTPLVQPTYYHDIPSTRSRPRTVSTPVRHVEAPRPIRPHPSQGPFIPVLDHKDRIKADLSHAALAPVGVPSAAYLEEQLRSSRSVRRTAPPPPNNMIDISDYVYPEETRPREVARRTGSTVTTKPSKAYLESLKDQRRELAQVKAPSAPPSKKSASKAWDEDQMAKKEIDFENWKPIPVDASKPVKDTNTKGPLKSALKKMLPTKPALKSALKKDPTNPYHSETETDRRVNDRTTPKRGSFAPSKAYLEEQKEKNEARGWHPRHQNPVLARPTVHEIRPSAFTSTHSSSTGSSPSEYANTHPYDAPRSRRGSFVDARPLPSSYIDPFIKEEDPRRARAVNNVPPAQPTKWQNNLSIHVPLTWPLIDYALRKRDVYPLVCFDTAFNPRMENYPIRTKRGLESRPLSDEEKKMPAALGMNTKEMWIVHRDLHKWPIQVREKRIRVIDVFMAIYDEYSIPLTSQELVEIGPEYLERCRRSFEQRCRDGPSWRHIEEAKGFLRIDLLRGRRIFKGIQPVAGQPATYELLLD